MRNKGEARLAIEAMARAGGAAVREFTGRRPAGETSCRCTDGYASGCDGGGVAPRADGACGCSCHGGATTKAPAAAPTTLWAEGASCRCVGWDATDCDGGGVAPRADGACGCPCHGGAEATNAVSAPVTAPTAANTTVTTVTKQECTGVTARWCPRCGDCICPLREGWPDEFTFDGDDCPLHGERSAHAATDTMDTMDTMDAATEAFDAIAKLCGCPRWEYPGQVVRDVQAVVAERDALRGLRAVRDAAVELVAAERELAKVHPALRTRSEGGIAAVDRVLKARRDLGALVPSEPDTVPAVPTVVAANSAEVSRG